MIAAAKHLNARGDNAQVLAALDQAVDDDDRVRRPLAVLGLFPSGPFAAAYVELWIRRRARIRSSRKRCANPT